MVIAKPFHVEVSGLEWALRSAGYPMQTSIQQDEAKIETDTKDLMRCEKLGHTPIGSGHDKFLRFINVQFDITAPRYWWQEFATYHFAEMQSQSTMHRITKMNLTDSCNEYVDGRIIAILKSYIDGYNKEPSFDRFMRIKSNLPEGFLLTARISTNYSQLKTIYQQRNNHRLKEWHTFCDWIRQLPHANLLGLV